MARRLDSNVVVSKEEESYFKIPSVFNMLIQEIIQIKGSEIMIINFKSKMEIDEEDQLIIGSIIQEAFLGKMK